MKKWQKIVLGIIGATVGIGTIGYLAVRTTMESIITIIFSMFGC